MIILRFLLFPFSLIYTLIASVRNWLFNTGVLKSVEFDLPVINVGNLRVGGTGKTPHVEFLINLLKRDYKIATLSRGYGRETRGFLLADDTCNARDIGDEPLQLYKKFKNEVVVSVCEDRALAIPRLVSENENINLIILDDAFQHRYVKPKLNIMLTSYDKPFYKDFILPSGMLRESHYGARRADIIIVSKCPQEIESEEMDKIKKSIRIFSRNDTPIFFSALNYGTPVSFDGVNRDCPNDIFLVSGLANEKPFITKVKSKYNVLAEKHYADHYDYYSDDVEEIVAWLDKHPDAALLCTEKDFVKLYDERFQKSFESRNAFYLPVEVEILQEKDEFLRQVQEFIK